MDKRNSFVSRKSSIISTDRPLYRFSSKNISEHPVVFYDDKHLYKDDVNKKLVQLPLLINHTRRNIDISHKSLSTGGSYLYKNKSISKSRYMDGVRPDYYQRIADKIEKFQSLEKDFQ
jgi:hypothetical protein